MLELIRASSLDGFPDLVRSLNGDSDALLLDAGIAPRLVGDVNAYVPYRSVAIVVERAAAALRCPDFGLRLAERRDPETLGPVALIARHATTVGDGLQGVAKYLHTYSPAIRIAIHPLRPGEARYTVTILATRLPARAQVQELSLGVALQVFRLLIGNTFSPVRVAIPHAPISTPATYRSYFNADVQFDQERCGFDLRSDDLARPVARDDALIRELVTRYLESPAAASHDTPPGTVKGLIARMLPTGHCSIVNVANALAVHPRTLQRILAAEDLTFESLLTEVRREHARHYLEASNMPLSQLSALLGYTDQSSLSRACRAWFGVSPRMLRTRHRTSASARRGPFEADSGLEPATSNRKAGRPHHRQTPPSTGILLERPGLSPVGRESQARF